jgi:hypothetical protein
MRNAYKTLVAKPEGKSPLGRPERRWEDNIEMGVTGIAWKGVDRSNFDYHRVPWL